MGAKDLAIRLLSEHCLADIATVVLPGRHVVVEEVRRTQLHHVERVADEVALTRIDGYPVVLHVEYQADDQLHMPQRVIEYQGLLRARFPEHGVVSVVVYLRAEPPARPLQQAIDPHAGDWQLAFRYEVFRPWEQAITLDAVRARPGLGPLALLTPGVTERDLPELAAILERSQVPDLPPAELSAIAYVLGGHRFDRHLLHSYLRSAAMKDSVTYQEIIQEGREQGYSQGLAEGIVETILELAELRLGPLVSDLEARLETLTLAELQALKSAVLRAADDVEFAALLGAAGRRTH